MNQETHEMTRKWRVNADPVGIQAFQTVILRVSVSLAKRVVNICAESLLAAELLSSDFCPSVLRIVEWLFVSRTKPTVTKHCCDKCNGVSKDNYADWARAVFQPAGTPPPRS